MTQPASDNRVPIRRALVSVYDKTGLEELGRFLAARGVEILSTGGSAKALRAGGMEDVIFAGTSHRLSTPPRLSARVSYLVDSQNFVAASPPPQIRKEMIPPPSPSRCCLIVT